jgi:hypothetical protein
MNHIETAIMARAAHVYGKERVLDAYKFFVENGLPNMPAAILASASFDGGTDIKDSLLKTYRELVHELK